MVFFTYLTLSVPTTTDTVNAGTYDISSQSQHTVLVAWDGCERSTYEAAFTVENCAAVGGWFVHHHYQLRCIHSFHGLTLALVVTGL